MTRKSGLASADPQLHELLGAINELVAATKASNQSHRVSATRDAEVREDDDLGGSGAEPHDVIFALTSSQGTLALISALQAGFNFSALASIDREVFEDHHTHLQHIYTIATTLTIGISLFTCICGAILEQEGRVARGLALSKSGRERQLFEEDLHAWYNDIPAFVVFRTRVFWAFAFNIALFMFSLALLCMIKMPLGPGLSGAIIITIVAVFILQTVLWINKLFRENVLQVTHTMAAPTIERKSQYGAARQSGNFESFARLEEEDPVA